MMNVLKVITLLFGIVPWLISCGSDSSSCGGYCETAYAKYALCYGIAQNDSDKSQFVKSCTTTAEQCGTTSAVCATADKNIKAMSCTEFQTFITNATNSSGYGKGCG